jgi:predicted ATP-binding protein involved in virulence
MPTDEKASDAMHFRSLCLENVRAFGSTQSLEFVDENNVVSRWNLILGENGVGKTTLMQALAVMRPIPASKDSKSSVRKSAEAPTPKLSRAELSWHEDDEEFVRFVRTGGTRKATMTAVLDINRQRRKRKTLKVGVEITTSKGKLQGVKYHDAAYALNAEGPLVIGYGAGRYIGHRNLAIVEERSATGSLFSDAIDLYDAEDIMEKLDHAAKSNPNRRSGADARRFNQLKSVVASLLPNTKPEDIQFRGPRIAFRNPNRSGVHVRTPSGMVPLADLSLGYQAMFAWTVDLAWRLFNAFPKSPNPLFQSAIVLIDEIDLHLHPQWQRDLRRRLQAHFPNVQFIATTHNPVTAQDALSEGGSTVAVVRWENDEAHILNNPIPRGEWRSDQLLESELFGFGSDRSQPAEKKLYERVALLRNSNRSAEQEARLRELDQFVASLPTARSPSAQTFEELMMNLARDIPSGVAR